MKLMVPPILSAAVVGLVTAVAVLGCGGSEGLPDDAVAEVGDTVITKSDFERALRFATGRGNDPRDYAACVAAKRTAAGGTGGDQPGEAKLETQCREEYEQIKSNVMDYLIKSEWTRREAEARGIVVTDAQLEKVVANARRVGMLGADALRKAGVSEREMFRRVRYNQLQARVRQQLRHEARAVSSQEIADYYRRNKADLVVPDQRKARIVVTRTRARAEAAREALVSGRSWERVAKQYSIHFSRTDGGKITASWKREDKAGLGAALFRARKGELMGPVKSGDTWVVFVAAKLERSHVPTLDQAGDEITKRLRSTRDNQTLDAYTRKYRDKTTCASGFKVPACKNGPEQTKDQPSA